jgi:hypothetical protein
MTAVALMENIKMKIKNKKFILISLAIILISIFIYNIFSKKYAERAPIEKLTEKYFTSKAIKNQFRLYKIREKVDPSFERLVIIPTSKLPIDIVIPLVEKDLEIVERTVKAAKSLVEHRIGNIYFIAPESKKIRMVANKLGCKFVLEDTVLPSKEIKKLGGWFIQQFLKLNADNFVENEHYLVVDADTIFIRPVIFTMDDGTYLINAHWDASVIRKKTSSFILGNKKIFLYDFVCHHMLFSKKILKEMKTHIEKRFQKRWDLAILDLFEKEKNNKDFEPGFSEYDLYATYLTEFSDAKFRFIGNANITVYRNFLDRLDYIIPAYAGQYKSISLHHFILFK